MAKSADVSKAAVQRLWSASDIKPHVTRTLKLSNDKQFEAKYWDVIGLYLNPPDRALGKPRVRKSSPKSAGPGGLP